MVEGILDAAEVARKNISHIFQFAHTITYAEVIERFLQEKVDPKD